MRYKKIVKIGSARINNLSFEEAVQTIIHMIKGGKNHYVLTPNVDHLITLEDDSLFLEIYRKADLIVADGMPLVWAAKYFGTPLKQRIAGSDLMPALCRSAAIRGHKIFLLGGRPGAAEKAKIHLQNINPDLIVCGTYCPPYGFENDHKENAKIIREIQKGNPHILFVGLGAPKQEKWIYTHKDKMDVPVSIGIGVTIEFLAGMVSRAPVFMQNSGLEWLWRLAMEPGKLWQRYLVRDMRFFKMIWKQKKSESSN